MWIAEYNSSAKLLNNIFIIWIMCAFALLKYITKSTTLI